MHVVCLKTLPDHERIHSKCDVSHHWPCYSAAQRCTPLFLQDLQCELSCSPMDSQCYDSRFKNVLDMTTKSTFPWERLKIQDKTRQKNDIHCFTECYWDWDEQVTLADENNILINHQIPEIKIEAQQLVCARLIGQQLKFPPQTPLGLCLAEPIECSHPWSRIPRLWPTLQPAPDEPKQHSIAAAHSIKMYQASVRFRNSWSSDCLRPLEDFKRFLCIMLNTHSIHLKISKKMKNLNPPWLVDNKIPATSWVRTPPTALAAPSIVAEIPATEQEVSLTSKSPWIDWIELSQIVQILPWDYQVQKSLLFVSIRSYSCRMLSTFANTRPIQQSCETTPKNQHDCSNRNNNSR